MTTFQGVTSLDTLVRAVVAGDSAAWAALQLEVIRRVDSIVPSHESVRARGLQRLDDDLQELKTATLERLSANDFRNLRRYVALLDDANLNRKQTFESWLYGTVDFAIREHLRRRYGRAPTQPKNEFNTPSPSKRAFHTESLPLEDAEGSDALVHTLGITRGIAAAEIVTYVDDNFADDEVQAFRLHYLEDVAFSEIAQALALGDSHEAEKLLRRLTARLRLHFGEED
jgi:DNA-directed RNA polymerase specialized sigma24 family protein